MKIQITREAVQRAIATEVQEDESGQCEKFENNKGKPGCPNGYHRSPDSDCEPARD
jgi:hypothetical protein